MCQRFQGRVALVTGASRGIGRATALALAREGATVVVNYQARVAQADVTDQAAVVRMVEETLAALGKIDILINNAGISRDMLMLQMEEADWRAVVETNLNGAFLCSKAVLRPMLKQRYGRIVNVASLAGLSGNVGQANYVAAKAGLVGLTKAMAREVATRGITVNAVAPAFCETDLIEHMPARYREWALAIIPMKRFARLEEVVAPILFLASEEASYVNGHALVVDGGMVCP
jgi:3-oxoacyl-[acyl-carrier protein] reductase